MVDLGESTPHPGQQQPAASEMRCGRLNSNEGPELLAPVRVSRID